MGSPATLTGFAEQHRLRMNRDECHDAIVRGKLGHLYEHGAGLFGIVLEARANSVSLETNTSLPETSSNSWGFRSASGRRL